MIIEKDIPSVKEQLGRLRQGAASLAFVPTMGALHEGHLSLIREAKGQYGICAVSIFLNPAQFNDKKDLKEYPVSFDEDIRKLRKEGVDLLFAPDESIIYPEGFSSSVETSAANDILCATSRPGHFKGVTTVVAKLFNIIRPDAAFFGEKDFQQLFIIKRLCEDLNFDINIVGCPIVRESGGLALSSRNALLSSVGRERALSLNKALQAAHAAYMDGERDCSALQRTALTEVEAKTDKVDYAEIRESSSLALSKEAGDESRLFLACFVEGVRLIDNGLLSENIHSI